LYNLANVPTADLTFLYGESIPRCTHRIDKVFKGYSTLQYMSGGGVELAVGPKRFALEGRWFWSAYPGPRISFHAADSAGAWRHRYIAFRGPLVERWRQQGLFPIAPQMPPHDMDYGSRFDLLLRLAMRPGPSVVHLRAIHELEGILIDLAEARDNAQTRSRWLEQTLVHLEKAVAGGDVDYVKLAQACDMSERTLRRKFKNTMGLSLHQFVLHQRVAEARRLLRETALPMKSIAKALGYSDVYFFTRQFRQLAGVPPALYRTIPQF
jgi:AraC-like DNA-binding protein